MHGKSYNKRKKGIKSVINLIEIKMKILFLSDVVNIIFDVKNFKRNIKVVIF